MNRIVLLLALAAAPLAAQQPDSAHKPAMPMAPQMGRHQMAGGMMGSDEMMGPMQAHMMQMMQMMGPMMQGMAFAPEHLLANTDALKLDAQQVTRLTALRDAAKQAHDAAAAEAKTHMDEMAEAMDAAKPDTAQIKTHFQAAQAAMGRAHWAMLSAAAQARALLNDQQRGWVQGWSAAMHEHMRMQMRSGGPMGGGMMMPRDSGRPR
jgi:hypothetical protein